jgi:hypothetical protein
MIEPIARRFLEYEKRKYVVITLTVVTTLVMVWPAVDEYSAAKQRTKDAVAEKDNSQEEVALLEQYVAAHDKRQQELAALEQQMVSEKIAQSLQNQFTELGRQTGCQVRRARLSEPGRRDWKDDDHPIRGARSGRKGEETPFRLETRQLALQVTGHMAGLYEFLARLHRVEKVMHSKAVTIRRSSEDGSTASLNMDILLFDLTRKPAKS